MELQHVNVKIYVDGDGDLPVDPERFIITFHRWVAEQSTDELLIDVADYRHVPQGPGIVLVGHEADYAMDHAGGRWGLLYNRKAPLEGSNEDRLRQAFRAAAAACQRWEAEFADDGPLKFSRQEFELFINDRALAPNTPETYEACQGEIEAFLKNELGEGDYRLERCSEDARRRFGVVVAAAVPFELAAEQAAAV